MKKYINFIDVVDEKGRLTELKAYRSDKQQKIEITHTYSIKYCYEQLKDYPIEDKRKKTIGLEKLLRPYII